MTPPTGGVSGTGPPPPGGGGRQDDDAPDVLPVAVRFPTAASALVFVGCLPEPGRPSREGTVGYGRDETSWWVFARLPLDLGRHWADATSGEVFLARGTVLTRDRGWGDADRALRGPTACRVSRASVRPAGLLDLVRQAGLHPVAPRRLVEAVVLSPAQHASGVIRRALDLGLGVTYRSARLGPLFDEPAQRGVVVELVLQTPRGALHSGFLDAVHRDPFTVLCRRVGGEDGVLMQYRRASPLPDEPLLRLAAEHRAREAGHGAWLLSASEYGCARLRREGEPRDGAALVDFDIDRPLHDMARDPGWTDSGPSAPPAPRLTVVPARTPGVDVDAVLLHSDQLDSVRLVLEGRALADSAQLVPGRDHHLVLAAGGLLERLPLGEQLYCVGPGPLYLPLGHRTDPRLPPSARQALFRPDTDRAVVLTSGAAYAFDLSLRRPVWELWAGSAPELDLQLPPDAEGVLRSLDAEHGPAAPADSAPSPTSPASSSAAVPPRPRTTEPGGRVGGSSPLTTALRTWRDAALVAELSGDLVSAAELHERHGDALRAAHLYERAARQSAETGQEQ